jgi:hypothetical protein
MLPVWAIGLACDFAFLTKVNTFLFTEISGFYGGEFEVAFAMVYCIV